jgi:hypothetical protein
MEQGMVHFHDRARQIFFALFDQYQRSADGIDRQGDENVYQQVLAMYIAQLKQNLQDVAQEMISQSGKGDTGTTASELHHALGSTIREYINEFVQKANAR